MERRYFRRRIMVAESGSGVVECFSDGRGPSRFPFSGLFGGVNGSGSLDRAVQVVSDWILTVG